MDGISAMQGGLGSLRDLSGFNRPLQAGGQDAFSLLSSISGDYLRPFDPMDSPYSASEKPIGAAANAGQEGKVDRSSKLYEQALELESYFVKIMLTSMRNTVQRVSFTGEESFAAKVYEDMLYDELSRAVTRNAGFGLADQIYLQLS